MNNDTRFSLVYVRKSGEPYSVTFDGYDDAFANAKSDGGYDAAYIPTGIDPNVNFVKNVEGSLVADADVAAAVMAHVNGLDYHLIKEVLFLEMPSTVLGYLLI